MLGWIITLLILAAIAAVLGFSDVASAFAGIAQVLFYILLAIIGIVIIAGMFVGKKVSNAFKQ
jgi:uncharacterized membrane protein YtjA (UPF0391 family)